MNNEWVDISYETYGRYVCCFGYNGVLYSEYDEGFFDAPKWFSKPKPGQSETRRYNPLLEPFRKLTRKWSYKE